MIDLFDMSLKVKGLNSKREKYTANILSNFDYGRDLTTEDDFNKFANSYCGWVYIASTRNATSVAQTPLKLYASKERKTQKIKTFPTREVSIETKNYLSHNPALIQKASYRKSEDIVEIVEHPFLDLINSVNGFMNRFYLFELTQLYQELTGNSYWYIIKNKIGLPQEIWPMPPQNMRIIPDKKSFIKGYEYQKWNSGINFLSSSSLNTIFYKEDEVTHFKMPSPKSLYYGVGPLSACFDEFSLGQQMNLYDNAIFKNNGRIDGAFYTEQELGDHEFERIKQELKSSFGGTMNAGKTPILDNGLKFQPYSYSPRDLAYDKGRSKVKEIITNAFGQSLGLYDREANRNNAEVAVNQFLRNAICPRLNRLEEKINEKILPLYDKSLFCAFENPVTEDKETRLKEIKVLLETGYSTVDEQRKRDRLEPLNTESSNESFKPVNMAPSDLILEHFKNIDSESVNDPIKNLNDFAEKFEERIQRYNTDKE